MDLVTRSRAGDGAAFEVIMRRHNRLLFRTARGVVGDDAEAQDVVQETYLRAFSRLATFRGDAALGTWLARIAVNVALDVARKRGRMVQFDETQDLGAEPPAEQMMSFRTPESEAPEMVTERAQTRVMLQSAIERLPPIYRSAFMLRAVEEMSVNEAAFCLHVSEDVVKTRYLRARSMLRDTLRAQFEGCEPEVFAFAGARCDAVINSVLTRLRRDGAIRPG